MPITVSRGKSGDHPFVKILFQTYGVSHFEQDGRRFDLAPGDCLAYDVSCPHCIVSPSLTRHEVVIVPKELLMERGFHSAKLSPANFRHAQAPAVSPMTSCTPHSAKLPYCRRKRARRRRYADRPLAPATSRGRYGIRPGRSAGALRAGSSLHQRTFARPGSEHRPDLRGVGLHQTLPAHAVQREGHDRQRLHLAGKAAALPSGAGDPGGKTITDVAFSWGFSSSSHFSRVFRKYFGIVPSSILHKSQQPGSV